MRTTQQFSITLPNEMADVVKHKVEVGEYASESEVFRDGLRILMARDRAVENWLREQVGPAYDALKADPARAVAVEQVRAMLAAQHKQFTAKQYKYPSSACFTADKTTRLFSCLIWTNYPKFGSWTQNVNINQ